MRKMIIAAAALLCGGSAHAQNDLNLFSDIMRSMKGQCDLQLNGTTVPCEGTLVYNHLKVGRTLIIISTKQAIASTEQMITFDGGKDQQPTLGDYQLFVDKVALNATLGPAHGMCAAKLNADGSWVYKVTCNVQAQTGMKFDLTFTPNTAPVNLLTQ